MQATLTRTDDNDACAGRTKKIEIVLSLSRKRSYVDVPGITERRVRNISAFAHAFCGLSV